MTTATDVLADGYGRVREAVHDVVDGLDADALAYRPDPEANSIAWLVWHLSRVQDDHVAEVAGTEQRWTAGGWVHRFSLPFDPAATGHGQRPDEVGSVRVGAELLAGYHDAVHGATADYLRHLEEADLERVVDRRWDPPVTLAVRLVSVLADDLQHVGQAAYLRGMLERRRR